MRINKYLAECGVASRRKSEEFILQKKVKINGRIVTDLATEVTNKDIVTIDGKQVTPIQSHIYIMLNKPKGYICTTSDELGRKTVMELVSAYRDKRLFPVGRLDYETEGLLIMTTDGALAQRLTHPSNEIAKTYLVKIEGEIDESDLQKLRGGIILDGSKTKPCKVVALGISDNITRLQITITEGRNRQVRRMFEAINREVIFLKRTSISMLRLGGLSRGKYRLLNEKEIGILKSC